VRASIGDAQAKIIARCLENDPARRYQSAAEVKLELEQLLRDAGIDEPVRELAAFVRAPEAHAANVRARLVSRSLSAGEEHLTHKRTSAALAAFGRALALEPQNAQARGRVDRIRRRDRLLKLARGTIIGLVSVAVLIAAGWELYRATQREYARAAVERAAQEKLALEQSAREKAAAQSGAKPLTPPPAQQGATSSPSPLASAPPVRRPPPPPPKLPELVDVKLHPRYGAQVTVDGRNLGNESIFELKLAPGPHSVTVHHPCCSDANQVVTVTKNEPGKIYKLEYGFPNPALFKVVNAPADARVLVNGVLVGTASDPHPYTMIKEVQRATVVIGDRSLSVTLKAGVVNELDYDKAKATM
jgi:hypothetical protein